MSITPAPQGEIQLPELPLKTCLYVGATDAIFGYTADQMRAYALASRPADTGERGAVTEAVGHVYAALRSIRYNANNGHQDRPARIRLRMIADEAEKAINKMDAALTQGGGNGR